MPRRLEIRTTILSKKSEGRAREKDANSNDVYADEALDLLEELQQLKSNMKRTDERIVGTYTKSPSSKSRKKKKPDDSPGKKLAYDVVYPSVAAGSERRRDTVVSHCLNPGSSSSGGGNDDDGRHDLAAATRSGFYSTGRPWASARTNFTAAPPPPQPPVQTAGPSHAYWPSVATTSTKTTPSSTLADERSNRAAAAGAFRHDGHARQQRVVETSTSSSSSCAGGDGELAGTGRFKRIYAKTTTRPSDLSAGEITEPTGNASHDDERETANQPAGGADGVGEDDDGGDRTGNAGENAGHASMPLNSSQDPSNQLEPEWVDGAEVDDSFQHHGPDEDNSRLVAGMVEEEEETTLVAAHQETEELLQPVPDLEQEPSAGQPAMESRNQKKAERMRHYDREEIRQYMQKQKKERKEKLLAGKRPVYVCQHNRANPVKRSDMGLPDKPRVVVTNNRRKPERVGAHNKWPEQDWGPYDKPNFVDILTSPTAAAARQKEEGKTAKKQREKSVQTEPVVAHQKVDEATQVTARSANDDSATSSVDWLHSLPTASVTGRRQQPAAENSQATDVDNLRSQSTTESTSRSRLLPQDRLVPVVTAEPKPKPVTNLLRKIENLEFYIGNLLEAPTFHSLQLHPVHPPVERPRTRDIALPPPTSYRSSARVESPVRQEEAAPSLPSFRPPPPPPPANGRTVPDGPSQTRQVVAQPIPPTPPPRHSSSVRHQLDTTASTEYRPLPDHLAEFLRLEKHSRDDGSSVGKRQVSRTAELAGKPDLKNQTKDKSGRARYGVMEEAAAATDLSSLFPLSRPSTEVVAARAVESRPPPQQPPPVGRQEEPQTYFRDFNEILQMDPNPLTERSNSWKRVAASRPARSSATDTAGAGFPLPAPAPYTILSALSDELKATMNRIPRRAADNNSSDSDFQSRLSVSDISVPDAVGKTAGADSSATAAHSAPPSASSRNEIQPPKNGSGSRTVHEAGSRLTANQLEQKNLAAEAADASHFDMNTTYMTLTPQYTSFEATASLAMPLDSTSIVDGPALLLPEKEANDRSMFSAKLSPIPRAVSPLSLVSDSEPSIHTERKQSTSSSDRSERDRSVGEKMMDESNSRLKTPSPRTVQLPGGLVEADAAKKSEELLARLRAEIQRDESLYRSLQHVERLEDSATTKESASKRFRIQIDSKTKTFFEAQTEALRAVAQNVGLMAPVSAAFLQGSQAAMEVDRVQGRKTLDSGRQTYTSDFDEPSVRSSPEIPTEIPTESVAKSAQKSPRRPVMDPGSDSERGGLDSSVASDVSVLPPKAVDVLLQEEAKQQRLLLKLREKAQVEKTLAELELLQMQKRILRAQGERDKAASIKKKQRGLLLKLQEERARIEALRRQHKKEEQRSKGSDHHYDSSSWETDWSAASNSTAAADTSASVREVSNVDQGGDEDESSTSTLQPISEAIQGTQAASNDEAVDDDAEVSQPRSEIEGQESGSALSNLRLRAPLSPRTTTESIRLRTKFRRRHSSGSDDSINLSQNETASDVSDVESRLLALTDQLQRRQAEAQRLKIEHRRLSKEKLKAQESALIKQIEVYDRCITDLRTQLDTDAETGATANAVVAVRPVIRQPRALIRADEAKSPTSARSESEAKIDSESAKSLEAEGQTSLPDRKAADVSSGTSSISTQIRTEAEEAASFQSDHDSVKEVEILPEAEETLLPVIESAESEKSLSELSTDPSATHENQAEISDSGRTDVFNQTMIIKSDWQVKEELVDDISKSILDQLVEETIDLATQLVLKKKKDLVVSASNSQQKSDVLQRVSALLSTGTDVPKGNRSQSNLSYLTTTFDLLSPDDLHSPVAPTTGDNESSFTFAGSGPSAPHCDVASVEGRDALESKLNELRFENENEWIDDELEVAPVLPDSVPDENRDKVIQEAEALEREQKRIEQEIQRLSAGSVQLYIGREIPNKPPPPYTPPGQALNWQKIRSPAVAEVKQIIPKSKDDVAGYCRRFTEYLLDRYPQPDIQFPDELFNVDHPLADQPAECQLNCRAFLTLLADLSRLYLSDLSKRATFLSGQKSVAGVGGRPIRSRTELVEAVEASVLVQLNYRPRLLRESQLARWSQKKRDRVDEILVRELQTEEKLWTDFSSEEVQVKRQTADAILDFLLDETAFICKRIIQTNQ